MAAIMLKKQKMLAFNWQISSRKSFNAKRNKQKTLYGGRSFPALCESSHILYVGCMIITYMKKANTKAMTGKFGLSYWCIMFFTKELI